MKSSQGAEHMETVTPGFPSSCWEWEGRWCCSGCVCGLTCSCLWSNAMGQGDGNGAGGVLLAWVSHTGGGCGPCVQGEKGTLGPCRFHLVPVGRYRPPLESPTQPLLCAQPQRSHLREQKWLTSLPHHRASPLYHHPGPTRAHPCIPIHVPFGHSIPIPALPVSASPSLSPSVHPHPCPSRLNITIPSAQHPDPSIPSPVPPPRPCVPTTLLTPPFAAAFGQQSPSPSAVPRFIRASKAEGWPSRSLLGPCVFTFTLCFEYFPPRSM